MTTPDKTKSGKSNPKYYIYQIEWVYLTPELKNKYLLKPLTNSQYIAIGKTISYSAEAIRKVFLNDPERVNKVIWDAIVKYVEAKKMPMTPLQKFDENMGMLVPEGVTLMKNGKPFKPKKKFQYVEGKDMKVKESKKGISATVTVNSRKKEMPAGLSKVDKLKWMRENKK